jgi:hypothetical protein
MMVLDASAVVTGLLVAGPAGDAARRCCVRAAARSPPPARCVSAISGIWPPTGHAHEPVLDRVLDFRDAVSAYDAVYVALAEPLGAAWSPAGTSARSPLHRDSADAVNLNRREPEPLSACTGVTTRPRSRARHSPAADSLP